MKKRRIKPKPKEAKSDAPEKGGIRNEYEDHSVAGYYQTFGRAYRNPHEPVVREVLRQALPKWQPDLSAVLDLACGSGEITLALRELGHLNTHGIDAYTAEAYQGRTGQQAEVMSFEDIAHGKLGERRYSLIVCSFALHLAKRSYLPGLLFELRRVAPALLVLTPNKRPELKPEWKWSLVGELMHERVRARYYLGESSDVNAAPPHRKPWRAI